MSEENESKIEQKESFKEDETKEDNMPSMKNNITWYVFKV